MKEDPQQLHWDRAYSTDTDFFGVEPSGAVKKAGERFLQANAVKLIELGAGQGRDTVYLASLGFQVYALDYSENAIWGITDRVLRLELGEAVVPVFHDFRNPLPFADATVDGCFSHMLYCMALSRAEIAFLNGEVRRVLKPGGLNIYTVRHKGDPHYGAGRHLGEELYEMNGFVVHYFDRTHIEDLASGYDLLAVEEFEEGPLPRKLYQVTLRKRTE